MQNSLGKLFQFKILILLKLTVDGDRIMWGFLVIFVASIELTVTQDFSRLNFRLIYSFDQNTKYYLNESTKLLLDQKFDKKLKTVFYTSGYTENFNTASNQAIIRAYLQRNDHNIIIFDWGNYSSGNYFSVAGTTSKIADRYSDSLLLMIRNGLDIEKVHLVGHSLGAQISGQVGRLTIIKSKGLYRLPRITGLDPAFPGFSPTSNIRFYVPINLLDAKFVDLIHTDNLVGLKISTGTADFYPNFFQQPGCSTNYLMPKEHACNHGRAWEYFCESVAANCRTVFHASKCSSWFHFLIGQCTGEIVNMGLDVDLKAYGNYYLQTSDDTFYSRNLRGAYFNQKTTSLRSSTNSSEMEELITLIESKTDLSNQVVVPTAI